MAKKVSKGKNEIVKEEKCDIIKTIFKLEIRL